MWKTLGDFSAQISRFQHILPLSTAQINCSGSDLPFFRKPDIVALVKVHGRAASKGIERIDARLAGHDQAGAGMGRCAGGGEGGEGVQAGQEVGPLADRLRWPGPRQLRGFPADSQTGHLPHRGCMRQGRRDAADTIWPVGGRDSRRLGLEEAWAGALRGLERRRRRIDLW